MIKTEQDFREYMKGKTIPFSLLLALKDLSESMAQDERALFENSHFSHYSEEEFEHTHNLLLAVVVKNSLILIKTFIKHLGISEDKVDMKIHPKITYDRETGQISVDRGGPDWLSILNSWSVCFDPPNTALKKLTEEEDIAISEEAREKSKEYISASAAKTLNEAELKHKIFNMVM
jgi:hypothetical protein